MNCGQPDPPSGTSWPSPEQAALHLARLAAGDPVAPSMFADAFLPPLIAHVRIAHPLADDHVCQTAAEDAIISFCKNPTQFDQSRRSLAGYLQMSADGDLRNLLASERRHQQKRENRDSVELNAAVRNKGHEVEPSDLPSFDHPALAAAIRAFSDAERRVLELMRDGERDTGRFAAALGLTQRSRDEQAAEVKRVKDRIKQRLKRAVEDKP